MALLHFVIHHLYFAETYLTKVTVKILIRFNELFITTPENCLWTIVEWVNDILSYKISN